MEKYSVDHGAPLEDLPPFSLPFNNNMGTEHSDPNLTDDSSDFNGDFC